MNRACGRGDPFTFGGVLELRNPPFRSARANGMHGTTVRFLEDGSPVNNHGLVW